MSVVINGIYYSMEMLESMSLDQIRALHYAEIEEQNRIAAAKAAPAEADPGFQKQEIIADSLSQNIALPKLKQLADQANAQIVHEQDLAEKQKLVAEAELDKETEGLTTAQIREKWQEDQNKQAVLATPEGQLQQQLQQQEEDLAKRVENLQYVESQLQKGSGQQLKDAAREIVLEQQAIAQREAQIAQQWVNTHPEYLADPRNGNGDKMIGFLRDNGLSLSNESLELAFTVLRSRNQLVLKDSKTVEQEQQIREQITNPKPTRKASSASASSSGNFYSKPAKSAEELEEEAYNMPMAELIRKSGGFDNTFGVGGIRR